jgi:gliding-associated putative ABC transporter substrate-binding component GldG
VVNWKSKKLGDLLLLANGIALALLLNLLASNYFFRVDLTEEKRYTIKEPTLELLRNLDDVVFVEVFLEGELNSGFERLQRSVRELLEEFRVHSGNKVQYTFTDPAAALGQKAQSEFMAELVSKGIDPLNVIDQKGSEHVQQLVFPGALVSYGGFETGVMLLKGNLAQGSQEVLNQSVEGVEFELANAIYKLSNTDRKRIAFVTGHGELDSAHVASFNNALLDQYDVFKLNLERRPAIENYDLLIIAKPRSRFSEADKFKIDQYVMRGGKLLMLLDRLEASMDSASRDDYYAFPYDLNLDDLLFRYGVRINPDLIQDKLSAKHAVVTGNFGNQSQIQPLDWPFFPLISRTADHPITRNLDAVELRFVSTIDSVKAEGISKKPLLFSSRQSRKVSTPARVSVADIVQLSSTPFDSEGFVLSYLLEGTFTSLYKNRFLPEGVEREEIIPESVPTGIIVVADGDIAKNEINPKTNQPQQLGFDPIFGHTFANQDLLLNMVAYLVEEDGLINARNKEIKIRPLDGQRVEAEKTYWQFFNLVVPLVAIVIYGILSAYWRRKKFAVQ